MFNHFLRNIILFLSINLVLGQVTQPIILFLISILSDDVLRSIEKAFDTRDYGIR